MRRGDRHRLDLVHEDPVARAGLHVVVPADGMVDGDVRPEDLHHVVRVVAEGPEDEVAHLLRAEEPPEVASEQDLAQRVDPPGAGGKRQRDRFAGPSPRNRAGGGST